jgi:hypothetical protein
MTSTAITIEAVQQKFGSCLLRLQECELLLKALVAHTEMNAPLEHLQEALGANTALVHGQTMGLVVGMFTQNTLVQAGAISMSSTPPDDSRAMVRFKCQIELPSEQYDALRSALKELTNLRNGLVHHFLQHYNMRSVEGRTAANAHLDECSQIIDAHRATLIGLTKALELSRAQLASFIGSQKFEDAILQGGLPD